MCVMRCTCCSSLQVVQFCKEKKVGLVVVGPEAPLVAGLADDLRAAGIPTWGPSAKAAQLEGSKVFMKVGVKLSKLYVIRQLHGAA